MPVLADIRKTQEELTLALAELDNIEASVGEGSGSSGHGSSGDSRLSERIQFLTEENKELSTVSLKIIKANLLKFICSKMRKLSEGLRK